MATRWVCRTAQGGARHRPEDAAAPVRPVSPSRRRRQAQGRGHHRQRPPDGRVRLADRLSGETATGRLNHYAITPAKKAEARPSSPSPVAMVGGGPRWGTFRRVMSRSAIDGRCQSEAAPRRNHGHWPQPALESLLNRRLDCPPPDHGRGCQPPLTPTILETITLAQHPCPQTGELSAAGLLVHRRTSSQPRREQRTSAMSKAERIGKPRLL